MEYFVIEKDNKIMSDCFGETLRFENRECAEYFIEKNKIENYEIVRRVI